MIAVHRNEVPVAIADGPLEVRTREIGGGMTTAFFRVPRDGPAPCSRGA